MIFSSCFFVCKRKTDTEKLKNGIFLHASVQKNGDPVLFIHVISGENARLLPQKIRHVGVTFEIYHLHLAFCRNAEFCSVDLHQNAKPLTILFMPIHGKGWMRGKEPFSLQTKLLKKIGFQLQTIYAFSL